jgi:DNA-binding transcriptional LysR family regulator
MQKHITLRQFRYFLAVSETASVAAAARMLNIAQSAVTKSVLELEDTLGLKLFERSSKGMLLTQEGYRFQANARKVISAVAQAALIDKDPQETLSGSMTIGVTSLVAGYYLADLFARFQKSHPSVKLTVVEDQPQFLEHLLINGELDLAIMVTNVLIEPRALQVESLTSSKNRVWMAANHPLADKQELSLAECATYPHIVLGADRVDDVLRKAWARFGLSPEVTMSTSSLEALRSLVGVGAGIAVLPDFLYRQWTLDAEYIHPRTLRDAIEAIDIGVVHRRSTRTRDVVLEFLSIAREQSRLGKTRKIH